MTGNPYSVSVRTPEILDKLEKHPIWQQRAAGESPRVASGHARRDRRRLRHQELRHRRGLFAGAQSNSRPDGKIAIYCDHVEMGNGIGTALANRVAAHLGRCGRRSRGRAGRQLRRARARHLRRSLHDGPEDAGRRGAKSALGAGDQFGDLCLDRRSCRDALRRPKPRASSSASVCGRQRSNCGASRRMTRAQRSGRRRSGRTGSSFMPGLDPAGVAGACREGACDAIS